jgi:hypothetical protein
LFYSLYPAYAFIDFIYRSGTTYHAFQVTIAEKHSCDPKYLLKFAEQAGGPSNFRLHYLTYGRNYGKFKLDIVNPHMLLDKQWTIDAVCIPRPDDEQKVPRRSIERTVNVT